MCGIAGIIQLQLVWSKAAIVEYLQTMADALSHRGPDGEGVWVSDTAEVGFAHRRLSIIDLSSAGAQPMWSHDRRFCITFNGEIYNYRELRQELAAIGARFRTETDTEVLIEAYRAYGDAALERLDGMFAFAVLDTADSSIFLARDPFGEKPLYYSAASNYFAFASELNALFAVPGFDDTVQPDELAKYLCLQYFDGESTVYRGARKLRPGHWARLCKGQPLQIGRYFEFSPAPERAARSIDDWADELEDILVTNLRRRLRADVPVGAFLSAGVDSSSVVALATRKLGIPIKTFSIGFAGFDGSEHRQAAEIAAHLGAEHQTELVSAGDLALTDRLAMLVDEPNGDTSLLPTYLLSKFARQEVKVALSGDGADELFGGYGRYMQTLAEERFVKDSTSPGRRYYSNRILVYTEHELARILAGPRSGLQEFMQALQIEVDHGNSDLLARLRKTDVEHYLPGAVLAKVDRMSMRHGLEVRTPFLNIAMARFAERLPTAMLANGDVGKLVLKHLAARYLPRDWMDRPKRGFGLPSYQWGGQVLKRHARSRLVEQRDRAVWWLHREGVSAWLDSLEHHNDNADYKLWALLHVQGYLRAKGGRPPMDVDPMMLIALRRAKKYARGATIAFAVRAIRGWTELLPGIQTTVAIWAGADDNVLVFDWMRDPAQALCLAQERIGMAITTVVLLDKSGCGDAFASGVEAAGVCRVLYYEDGQWRTRAAGFPAATSGSPPVLVFNAAEEMPHRFRFDRIIADLTSQLPGANRRITTAAQAASLFGSPPGLYRHDTPVRAWHLVMELFAWIATRRREQRAIRDLVKEARRSLPVPRFNGAQDAMRIALVISDLSSGGAERQLCNLAVGLKDEGHQVKVITLRSVLQGGAAHYAPLLQRHGVEVVSGGKVHDGFTETAVFEECLKAVLGLIGSLPVYLRRYLWPVYTHLASWRPDAMVSHLDHPNLVGGIAGLLSGTPRLVLSFRNVNPTHFDFYEPWYKRYYKALVASGRVCLTGNSSAGNRSYAHWLGIDSDCIETIRNGIDFSSIRIPSDEEVLTIKRTHNLVGRPVILGVFRLAKEKRPELFLRVVDETIRHVPNAKVLIVGDGPERAKIEREIQTRGLQNTIILVGRKTNVSTYMAAANVVLQTSSAEGTPNSLIEAQYLGVPVVATDVGGTAESVDHERSGYVLSTDDPRPIAEAVLRLLRDPETAIAMGRQGNHFVTREYSLERLVTGYSQLLKRSDSAELPR